MKSFYRLILFIIILGLPVAAFSQGVVTTIRGTVNNASGKHLVNAIVRITSMGLVAKTDGDGLFKIMIEEGDFAPQEVEVTAESAGHFTQTKTITIAPGTRLKQNFELTPLE